MSEIKSTRLRFISTKTAQELVETISALPFKVEIKGGPVSKDGRWFAFFVLPEQPLIKFDNVEL